MTVITINEEFQINPERGFLPSDDPLLALPEAYAPWEEAARNLSKFLMSGQVRKWLAEIPELPTDALQDRRALDRAMLLLSYFGAAWVWGEEKVDDEIPRNLAIPWCAVAARLGRPPILSYASHALNNWRRLDPSRGIELGNIVRLMNFYGGLDEEWFVLIHIVIEANAGPLLEAALDLRSAIVASDDTLARSSLQTMANSLSSMRKILARMPDGCDPYIYYRRVRPFIFGWAGNPALPNGVRYAGVPDFADNGQRFRGETGAQSAIVPAADAALGVRFSGNDEFAKHLTALREYIPPEHRRFIERLEQAEARRPCRKWIIEQPPSTGLAEAYNQVIEELHGFRRQHVAFAHEYIAQQQPKSESNPTGTGTGGTPFMIYLNSHADQTLSHRIA